MLKRNGLSFTWPWLAMDRWQVELRRQVRHWTSPIASGSLPNRRRPCRSGVVVFTVLTSANEGCPNAVMETMACGRAVVATDVGRADAGHARRTGFLVPSGDEPALVDAIARLITDRELCRRMGEAARAKAEREFSLIVWRARRWRRIERPVGRNERARRRAPGSW